MNSKNVLKRIVNLLSAEVKFASAKLVDGTIVESEDFAVGSEVFVVSEDGRELAPDAEHRVIIDDKEFKVVTEGGVITSVEEVEVEEVEAEEEVKVEEEVEMTEESTEPTEEVELEEIVEEEVEEEPLTLEKIYEEMKYRISELEKKVEEMQEVKEEIKEEVKEELEEEEEDLPVLDGAPVEMSKSQTKLGKKASQSYESKFLSRLYN